MAPGAGVSTFADPHFKGSLFLDGSAISGGMKPVELSRSPGPLAVAMRDQSWTLQSRWTGPDRPFDLTPFSGSLSFVVRTQADAELVDKAVRSPGPAGLFVSTWIQDFWSIPAANPGQTTWRASRSFPWNLAGVSHGTHRPRAYLVASDGVETEQEVITSGVPAAGQVVVPEDGSASIETPAAETLGANRLKLWFPPVLQALLALSYSLQEANGLGLGLEFSEVLA